MNDRIISLLSRTADAIMANELTFWLLAWGTLMSAVYVSVAAARFAVGG